MAIAVGEEALAVEDLDLRGYSSFCPSHCYIAALMHSCESFLEHGYSVVSCGSFQEMHTYEVLMNCKFLIDSTNTHN